MLEDSTVRYASLYFLKPNLKFGVLCWLMTPGLRKDIQCHV